MVSLKSDMIRSFYATLRAIRESIPALKLSEQSKLTATVGLTPLPPYSRGTEFTPEYRSTFKTMVGTPKIKAKLVSSSNSSVEGEEVGEEEKMFHEEDPFPGKSFRERAVMEPTYDHYRKIAQGPMAHPSQRFNASYKSLKKYFMLRDLSQKKRRIKAEYPRFVDAYDELKELRLEATKGFSYWTLLADTYLNNLEAQFEEISWAYEDSFVNPKELANQEKSPNQPPQVVDSQVMAQPLVQKKKLTLINEEEELEEDDHQERRLESSEDQLEGQHKRPTQLFNQLLNQKQQLRVHQEENQVTGVYGAGKTANTNRNEDFQRQTSRDKFTIPPGPTLSRDDDLESLRSSDFGQEDANARMDRLEKILETQAQLTRESNENQAKLTRENNEYQAKCRKEEIKMM